MLGRIRQKTFSPGIRSFLDLRANPNSRRQRHLTPTQTFMTELMRGCRLQNIDYVRLDVVWTLAIRLSSYLGHRLLHKKG